jgi:L-lactate utilization protein LutC
VLQERIDKIGRIVRTLPRTEHPGRAPIPAFEGDLVELFDQRLSALRAAGDGEPAVARVRDEAEAAKQIAEWCRGTPIDELVFADGVPVASQVPEPRPAPRDRAVGVTRAAALIAATGSVILELPHALDGRASLLVDRHIVVGECDRLLPDLPTFCQRLSERQAAGVPLPNMVCITGCSRTADIEKLLVVPAHGPRQVRVVVCRTRIDWPSLCRRVRSAL